MKSLGHLGRWRLFGLLAIAAAVAVAIPAASGAGPFAHGGANAQFSASTLYSHSVLLKAMGAPKGAPNGAGGKGYTCTGGSIPAGTYDSLTVAGFCSTDQGTVKVKRDVTVQAQSALFADFGGGPQLVVGGNLYVQDSAGLVLGCEPEASPCENDPNQEIGFLSSRATVYGNLYAENAFAVIVHNAYIGGNFTIHGGGGGLDCDTAGFNTVEDAAVGGNVTIDGVQACWMGFFRTSVVGNFNYDNNITGDPDGNEIQTNVVQRNMDCSGNNPAVQDGDSGGFPNTVFGHAGGECAAVSGP